MGWPNEEDDFPIFPIASKITGDWEDGVFYFANDGLPMCEAEGHTHALIDAFTTLSYWFRTRPEMYIAVGMFYHWERGNPDAHIHPHLMVARGVPYRPRRKNYKLWREQIVPCAVLDFVSEKPNRPGLSQRPARYAVTGIAEYFIFDALERTDPPLRGFRLTGARYEAIAPDSLNWLHSEQLGLMFRADGQHLLVADLATNCLPRYVIDDRLQAIEHRTSAMFEKLDAFAKQPQRSDTEREALAEEGEALHRDSRRFLTILNESDGKQRNA